MTFYIGRKLPWTRRLCNVVLWRSHWVSLLKVSARVGLVKGPWTAHEETSFWVSCFHSIYRTWMSSPTPGFIHRHACLILGVYSSLLLCVGVHSPCPQETQSVVCLFVPTDTQHHAWKNYLLLRTTSRLLFAVTTGCPWWTHFIELRFPHSKWKVYKCSF